MIRYVSVLAAALTLVVGVAVAQQHPLLDMAADKVIQKYQQSTCQQLWQSRGKPKAQREQEFIKLLKSNPELRTEFVNKVAAPVANKMFECGLIP